MTAAPPTPAELMAVGRLQAVCLLIADLARPAEGLAVSSAVADQGWRVDALAALRPLRVVASHGRGVPPFGAVEERAGVDAALVEIGAAAAVAVHAVETGNELLFRLAVVVKLRQAIATLARALDALSRAVLTRPSPVRSATGFAC